MLSPFHFGPGHGLGLGLGLGFRPSLCCRNFNSTQFFKSSWESFAIVLFSRFRRRASRFKAAVVALFCAPRRRCCSLKRVTFSD